MRKGQGGFTFIELMIILLIVSVLAAFAVQRFQGARERAFDAAVLSDFHRAYTAIEGYFAATLRYPTTPDEADFVPSTGVIFDTWAVEPVNGRDAMHLDARHVSVTHYFHNLGFPFTNEIERKTGSESESLALLLVPNGDRRAFDLTSLSLPTFYQPS